MVAVAKKAASWCAISDEELELVVQEYRTTKSELLATKLIELLMPLADIVAARFWRSRPNKRDDIRAQASFGAVQAVRWAPERMHDNNIGPYARVTMKRFVREFLEQDHIIPVPKDKWQEMVKALGLDDLEPQDADRAVRDLRSQFLVLQGSLIGPDGSFLEDFSQSLEPSISRVDPDIFSSREIQDLMHLSANERVILELRARGHTLEEIGSALKRKKSMMHKIIKDLQFRYVSLWRSHPTMPEPPKEWRNDPDVSSPSDR